MRKHGVETRTLDGDFSVALADGRITSETRMCTVPLTVKIADESEKQSFTVFPLARYDVILGRPWVVKNNPEINFQTNEVRIGSRPPWTACLTLNQESLGDDLDIQLNFISGKQARHALRQGDDGFLAWVTAGNSAEGMIDTTTDTTDHERRDLQVLLDEFQDVFPEELPSTLPPRRIIDHHIEVLPGSAPPSRPPYRLSKLLLDELQCQLEMLLEKGLIEPSRSPYGAPVFFIKGEVRAINDRNICKRRSCMKNNGKSPTFKFVSGEERRLWEVQRVSRGWRLPDATHSSADPTWIRK